VVVLLIGRRRDEATVDPDRALDELRLLVAAGSPVIDLDRLPERCRRAVALAQEVGAPLLEAVDAARAARDDVRRGERAVAIASAQTRVVAGGLLLAPVLLVPGLSRLVGADLLGFYSSSFGVLVLAVGVGLLALGAAIVVVLVRRVGRARQRSARRDPLALAAASLAGLVTYHLLGLALALPAALLIEHLWSGRRPPEAVAVGVDEAADLVATALAAGGSGPEALRLTADALPRHANRLRRLAFGLELGMEPDAIAADPPGTGAWAHQRGSGAPEPLYRLASLLAAAERTGAAVGPSVRHLAHEFRADDLARVLAAAERLPAQLTFPTALCLLPATVLLIGAPIVQTGLTAAGY